MEMLLCLSFFLVSNSIFTQDRKKGEKKAEFALEWGLGRKEETRKLKNEMLMF